MRKNFFSELQMTRPKIVCLSLLAPSAGIGFGNEIDVPMVEDAAALKSASEMSVASGRIFTVDLMKGKSGNLLEGSSDTELPAGRYRFHVSLAIAPLGHGKRAEAEVSELPKQPDTIVPDKTVPAALEVKDDDEKEGTDDEASGKEFLDVLIVKGLHHYLYRIPEAIRAAAPDARINQCTTGGIPKTYQEVFQYDIIVLADFVREGCKLVVLGGQSTLGQGFFKGTSLEKVLPVEVRPAKDVYRLLKPIAFGPKKNVPFKDSPLLYYYHATKPRDDTRTLLWAGELPLLLKRKVEKGKSLVFIGTALGEAQSKDEIPFWEWKDWPEIIGNAIVK